MTICGIIRLYFRNHNFEDVCWRGDKGTGRFDFTVGVLVCGFFYDYGGCNRLFHKSNPTPIINHHYSTVEVIEPPKRVLVEREVCKDIRGCVLLKGGECPTCVIESVWE